MFESLARSCFRRPWRVIGIWIVVIAAVVGAAAALGTSFESGAEIPNSESRNGFDLLEEHFGGLGAGQSGSLVFSAVEGVEDPDVRNEMTALIARIDDLDQVSVNSPYEPGGERLIAQQGAAAGTVAYAEIDLDPSVDETAAGEVGVAIDELVDESGVREQPGRQVEIGGQALGDFEPPESEALGLAFAIFVLIVAMGSVIAMGTTIGTAVISVAVGATGISVISIFTSVPEFALTIGLMIGLGVGIDYALFIITRYREALDQGFDSEEATVVALDTAGRSVLFAGTTVVVSLLGLLLMGLSFIRGLGISAAVTVAVVMIGSVTLLPAFIGLMGDRIRTTRWRGIVASILVSIALLGVGIGATPLTVGFPAAALVLVLGSLGGGSNPLKRKLKQRQSKALRDTIWYKLSRLVQRHSWGFAVGGTVLLVVMASPVLSLRLGFSDEGNFSEDTTTRQAYDLIADGFGPGANGPLTVIASVDSESDLDTLNRLSQTIGETEGVALVSPPRASTDGLAAIMQVQPTTSPQDAATSDLVETLRDDVIAPAVAGTTVDPMVTGLVASNIDFTTFLSGRLIIFFGAVLGVSFLLLMAVFRSLVVPLKAVIMNMLSIGAAYGIVVAVFQWGWFGFVEPAPIEPFLPMMLFAILFGLSMDYEVFLLSRMKEEYERTGDPVNSVADGLAATASVITAAGAIMVVVFGSFVFEDNRVIQLFGLGLASAVLIDASLVRMLIVPSTMELLGARNWWFPAWLDRLIPDLNVEGGHHEPPSRKEEETEPIADNEPALV